MEPYEVLIMFAPEAEEPRQDEVLARVRQIAETGGGEIEAIDAWGRRKLAYEIDHKGEAFYHVVTLTAPAEALAEIARVLKITDDVLRHMVTRRSLRHTGSPETAPVA